MVFLFLWLTELLLCIWRIIPHLHFKLEIKRPAVQALFSWTGLDAINPAFPSFPIIKTLDTYKSTFPGIVAQLKSESYMWTDDEVESYPVFFFLQKNSGNARKCILSSVWMFNLVTQVELPALFRHCILFIWCCFGRDKCCTPKRLSNNKNNKATVLEIFYHGFLFSVDERPNLTGKSFLAFPHATVHVDEAFLCAVCCVSADQKNRFTFSIGGNLLRRAKIMILWPPVGDNNPCSQPCNPSDKDSFIKGISVCVWSPKSRGFCVAQQGAKSKGHRLLTARTLV